MELEEGEEFSAGEVMQLHIIHTISTQCTLAARSLHILDTFLTHLRSRKVRFRFRRLVRLLPSWIGFRAFRRVFRYDAIEGHIPSTEMHLTVADTDNCIAIMQCRSSDYRIVPCQSCCVRIQRLRPFAEFDAVALLFGFDPFTAC